VELADVARPDEAGAEEVGAALSHSSDSCPLKRLIHQRRPQRIG
jgi:hypothetical protein